MHEKFIIAIIYLIFMFYDSLNKYIKHLFKHIWINIKTYFPDMGFSFLVMLCSRF